MIKKKVYPLLSALAGVAALAMSPAHAKKPESPPPAPVVSCAYSGAITGNAAYTGQCLGVLPGNIATNQNNTANFGNLSFDYFGSSSGHGAFEAGSNEQTEGTLLLTQTMYGMFVLGIKGGPSYSLYLFDGGGDGVDSIEYDTLGVTKGNGTPGPALSHAVLFTPSGLLPQKPAGSPSGGPSGDEPPNGTPPVDALPQTPTAQNVPEPATGALAFAALAAAGLTARRRRR